MIEASYSSELENGQASAKPALSTDVSRAKTSAGG
jgi:hypothetical protein